MVFSGVSTAAGFGLNVTVNGALKSFIAAVNRPSLRCVF